MTRMLTLAQEELMTRIKVFRSEVSRVGLEPLDCPLLSSQLKELTLLTGLLNRSILTLQKTLKESDTR